MQDPAFQFGHLRRIDALGVRETGEVAEEEAHGVAQAAIAVRDALQDLGTDALVGGVVRLGDPEAQDVGAVFLHHLVGDDGVAERLGHLVALLVQREAVGDDVAVGRAAKGAAGLEQRGMEPAAMLVGAFHVDVGDAVLGAVGAVAEDEGVGGAAIEPHVEDVEDLGVVFGVGVVGEEALLGALGIPAVGPFGLEGLGDAGVHGFVAEQVVGIGGQGARLREAGQRHAPGALARQHPVGAGLDHRMQAVAAGLGGELDQRVDRGQRALADRAAVVALAVVDGAVDGGEPLRRVAVDDRGLRAPGVGVAVLDAAARQKAARLDQLVDDGLVGVAFLALVGQYLRAAEEGQIGPEAAVVHHVVGDDLLQHSEVAVELVLLHPVGGGAVDEAGAFLVGDEGGGAEVPRVVPFGVGACRSREGMMQGHAFELRRGHVAQAAVHGAVEPRLRHNVGSELVGEDEAVPDRAPSILRGRR